MCWCEAGAYVADAGAETVAVRSAPRSHRRTHRTVVSTRTDKAVPNILYLHLNLMLCCEGSIVMSVLS